MPSSPEVWPPRVPIAQNTHGKGRREGTLKGTAATVMALNASRGGPKAAAKLACPCPPPPPQLGPPGTERHQQRGDWALYLSPHTLPAPRLSGDTGGNRFVELELPRARRGRDP